ncbi:hypothetical protein CVT24_007353 [Panaeolus cyanescens]|uniref:Ubiquitin-like protease family profile domain-containing protein n=1 Tax=Panaeolus cyanescens TaxID=181874 RepID=A0A409YWB3_9AGAR|nr:hypothetical protein CVT24_007353 [Panaeolus cyanescens]
MTSKARGKQPATSNGLGASFTSPKKKRPGKVRSAWPALDPQAEAARLQRNYQILKDSVYGPSNKFSNAENSESSKGEQGDVGGLSMVNEEEVPGKSSTENTGQQDYLDKASYPLYSAKASDTVTADTDDQLNTQKKGFKPNTESKPEKRLTPDIADQRRHARWVALLPNIMDNLLSYQSRSFGQETEVIASQVKHACLKQTICMRVKSAKILCLYFDHFKHVEITTCGCRSIQQILVANGLFPTSPSQTRMAVSIDMLSFYGSLFERSCDAVNALAHALNSFYLQRGYYLLDKKGNKFSEPFRKGLGYASRWLQVLKLQVEDAQKAAVEKADVEVQRALHISQDPSLVGEPMETEMTPTIEKLAPSKPQDLPDPVTGNHTPSSMKTDADVSNSASELSGLPLSEVARKLSQLCPACFGLKKFGRPLEEGGDFHVATDGNFHHRHATNAGAGISYRKPFHIIPPEFVNSVGEEIDRARKKAPKTVEKPKVPSSAVDECEKSYEAANGDKKKAAEGNNRFDSHGLMSLVCRHDIPLFFANIDTPGEQQKYSVALIRWLFKLIPTNATVTVLYDIGCVLDRSIELYDILTEDIASRTRLTTTAMHAYGHQWSCQLVYNPRMCDGLGLTDGEGVERNWSKMYKVIGIERVSSAAGRELILEQLISSIALEAREDLGAWIKRRIRHTNKQYKEATDQMNASGKSIAYLRQQWALQKTEQLSFQSTRPAQLKNEIDCILTLQDEIENLESVLGATKATLIKAGRRQTRRVLESLESQHETLVEEVGELYASLKIHHAYPQLKGLDADFTRTLLLAHDLKIDIRQRAVQSFFEWEKLDYAVGGKGQALGTKLHQATRKSISKRAPALVRSIRKFNSYCETLCQLKPGSSTIPLPTPLPTTLDDLRSDPTLHQDVWMVPNSPTETLPWLEDSKVRDGIRAMIKIDRCNEERYRLGIESDNMCRWFGRELLAAEVALRDPQNDSIKIPLTQYRDHILHLKSQWTSELASDLRYESHVKEALRLATKHFGITFNQQTPLGSVVTADVVESEEVMEVGDLRESLEAAIQDDRDIVRSDTFVLEDLLEDGTSQLSDGPDGRTGDGKAILCGELVQNLRVDKILLQQLALFNPASYHPESLTVAAFNTRRRRRAVFEKRELEILSSKTAMLNDGCLNGCASLLQELQATSISITHTAPSTHLQTTCAVFSTFDLVDIKSEADDFKLWRNVKRTEYWAKDTWILPIHRPEEMHWVLCIAYPATKQMHLFDSMGFDATSWRRDLKHISNLFTRLANILDRFTDHTMEMSAIDSWTAYPAVGRVQFNNYDCGLWVLLWIAAALRGFQSVGDRFPESVMSNWRSYLLNLIYSSTEKLA